MKSLSHQTEPLCSDMEVIITKCYMWYWQLMELVSSPLLEHEKLEGDKISLLQDFMRLVLLVMHLCPL